VTNGTCSGDTSPIYRLWSQVNKKYFFTTSEGKKDMITATYPKVVVDKGKILVITFIKGRENYV